MPGVFISYRREDSAAYAGRLYDHLAARFGADRVFMDIDTIRPGDDFVKVFSDKVAACEVLIAVIGKRWLTAPDPRGRRRLEDPNDYVRLEIVSALQRNVRVIPALVDGAQMPPPGELPPDLVPLSRRNAIEVTNTLFRQTVERLIQTIEESIKPGPQSSYRAAKIRQPAESQRPLRQEHIERQNTPESSAPATPALPIAAAAMAFFVLHILLSSPIRREQGYVILEAILQSAALYGIFKIPALGPSRSNKTSLTLSSCWLATAIALAIARPITANLRSTDVYSNLVVGAIQIALQVGAALLFGFLARHVQPGIPFRAVTIVARIWGIAALVLWIAATPYGPPLLLAHLNQALVGGSILWLLRQRSI